MDDDERRDYATGRASERDDDANRYEDMAYDAGWTYSYVRHCYRKWCEDGLMLYADTAREACEIEGLI